MLVAERTLESVSDQAVPITPRVLAPLVSDIKVAQFVADASREITLADLDARASASLAPDSLPVLRRAVADFVRQRWHRVAKVRPFAQMPNGLALSDLDLSVRAFNAMSRFPFTLLRGATVGDLLDTPGLGAGMLVEVLAAYEAAVADRRVAADTDFAASEQEDQPVEVEDVAEAPATVPQRVIEMRDLYEAGATLSDVADRFGVSRERVRQLLRDHGIPTRSVGEAAAFRREQLMNEHRDQIYALVDDGIVQSEICSRLGIAPHLVRQALEDDPERRRFASFRRTARATYKPRYTDAEIVECLREASHELGGVLTTAEFTKFSRTRKFADGRPWPGHQTPALRFGSWRAALAHAGLEANPPSAIAGQRIFTRAHCIDAILEVERNLGRVPTAADYERAAAASDGVLPSLATLRHRCGGWQQALVLAAQYSR